jgi:hypothetical protein
MQRNRRPKRAASRFSFRLSTTHPGAIMTATKNASFETESAAKAALVT